MDDRTDIYAYLGLQMESMSGRSVIDVDVDGNPTPAATTSLSQCSLLLVLDEKRENSWLLEVSPYTHDHQINAEACFLVSCGAHPLYQTNTGFQLGAYPAGLDSSIQSTLDQGIGTPHLESLIPGVCPVDFMVWRFSQSSRARWFDDLAHLMP